MESTTKFSVLPSQNEAVSDFAAYNEIFAAFTFMSFTSPIVGKYSLNYLCHFPNKATSGKLRAEFAPECAR